MPLVPLEPVIHAAMGGTDAPLHAFAIGGARYSIPHGDDGPDLPLSTSTRSGRLASSRQARASSTKAISGTTGTTALASRRPTRCTSPAARSSSARVRVRGRGRVPALPEATRTPSPILLPARAARESSPSWNGPAPASTRIESTAGARTRRSCAWPGFAGAGSGQSRAVPLRKTEVGGRLTGRRGSPGSRAPRRSTACNAVAEATVAGLPAPGGIDATRTDRALCLGATSTRGRRHCVAVTRAWMRRCGGASSSTAPHRSCGGGRFLRGAGSHARCNARRTRGMESVSGRWPPFPGDFPAHAHGGSRCRLAAP